MPLKSISIEDLSINKANDRHGKLDNEAAAIAWLFNNREVHMRNLAKDILDSNGIYEPPLVYPEGDRYTVFDGNRRTTCLKLITTPRRAPTVELQQFFKKLRDNWEGTLPSKIECQVEKDRDRIDEILFRRHTGSQNGVGQSMWDDRMKSNFVNRSGRGSGINVADEIEKRLEAANLMPKRKIPRANLNRLLSAETFRSRLGISVSKGRFKYTRIEDAALRAMARVASDLAEKKVVLGDIWDADGKDDYLDTLDKEGILPTVHDAIDKPNPKPVEPRPPKPPKPKPVPWPKKRDNLIPQVEYSIAWPERLQRHKAIWEELQFKLDLQAHPNAVSVLFRVLLELSIENYMSEAKPSSIHHNDKLAKKMLKVAEHLHAQGSLDHKYLAELKKVQNAEELVSVDTLHRYVHSPNFIPSPDHLRAIWDSLDRFLVLCLNA